MLFRWNELVAAMFDHTRFGNDITDFPSLGFQIVRKDTLLNWCKSIQTLPVRLWLTQINVSCSRSELDLSFFDSTLIGGDVLDML